VQLGDLGRRCQAGGADGAGAVLLQGGANAVLAEAGIDSGRAGVAVIQDAAIKQD